MNYPALIPNNPAALGYPPTLPIELALRESSPSDIQKAYGYENAEWAALWEDVGFTRAVAAAIEMLREEGMSFKTKAKLQAEELLKTSWKLIHAPSDEVSPAVKADLIKSTARWAGYEPKTGAQVGGDGALPLQINIQFNNANGTTIVQGDDA